MFGYGPAVKLNFSEFHPLDHPIWACQDYPGGKRRHLKYRWEFQWRDRLYEQTLCRVGAHHWTNVWGRGESWTACVHCGTRHPLSHSKGPEA